MGSVYINDKFDKVDQKALNLRVLPSLVFPNHVALTLTLKPNSFTPLKYVLKFSNTPDLESKFC